jgi:ABC-type bacteriocin/lantibiotic exporter with double-glycine peptidase domain
LWWGHFAPASWERHADDQGRLQQSSGLTCSPAAAVMLLHHYCIQASEGEMAYRARTSLLGTDAYSMARAIREKVQPHRLVATVRHVDYDACVRSGLPFLAHVRGPYMGHALFVKHASADHVDVIDPLDGIPKKMTRQAFAEMWDGTMIQILPAPVRPQSADAPTP